jgi:hypothetical protein
LQFQKYKDLPLIIRRRGRCWPVRKRTTCLQILTVQAAVTLLVVAVEYLYITNGRSEVATAQTQRREVGGGLRK